MNVSIEHTKNEHLSLQSSGFQSHHNQNCEQQQYLHLVGHGQQGKTSNCPQPVTRGWQIFSPLQNLQKKLINLLVFFAANKCLFRRASIIKHLSSHETTSTRHLIITGRKLATDRLIKPSMSARPRIRAATYNCSRTLYTISPDTFHYKKDKKRREVHM